jgi:hypothetical protein
MNKFLNIWYNSDLGVTVSSVVAIITFLISFIGICSNAGKDVSIGFYMFIALICLVVSLFAFLLFMSFWVPALALVIFILALIAKLISKLF